MIDITAPKNVLITGASGFVGGWLTRRLKEEGHNVRVLRRQSSDISAIEDLDIQHCIGDVTDAASLDQAIKGCDAVFHLAGLVAYAPEDRPAMEKVNVTGTQNVVDKCVEHKVPRLIHMSSVVAIGASFDGTPLNEDSEFNISHLNLGYFETKRKAEQIVKSAISDRGLDAVMLNPSTIYGAGDAKKGSRGVQLKVARGKFPVYPPGGVNVVAVEDVIEGLIRGWERGKSGERYILAGENLTLKEVFTIIAETAGVKPPKKKLHRVTIKVLGLIGQALSLIGKKGPMNRETAWTSVLYHWFENKKAQKELGLQFRPSREAIESSVKWVMEHPELK